MSIPANPRTKPAAEGSRYTVDELARKVGMSPRNIRAHQGRSLLAPPIREGRQVYYDDSHVQRLEVIKGLQRQGFNLHAVEAILGVRGADQTPDAVIALLQRLSREQPSLLHALDRHGVVARTGDGTVRMIHPRALRSALDLNRAGVNAVPSLQILSEVLDSLRLIADDLVRNTSARLLVLAPALTTTPGGSWEDFDGTAVALTQGLIVLLTEAFRVAVENFGRVSVVDLLAHQIDGELRADGSGTVDIG